MEALDVTEPGLEGGRLRRLKAALARERSYLDLEKSSFLTRKKGAMIRTQSNLELRVLLGNGAATGHCDGCEAPRCLLGPRNFLATNGLVQKLKSLAPEFPCR